MINEEILGGRTIKEFVDYMSDMLLEDNTLANDILSQYFNDMDDKECYNLRIDIIIEYLFKKGNKRQNGTFNK